MVTDQLKDAYLWHRQRKTTIDGTHGLKVPCMAIWAYTFARADVLAGRKRYPASLTKAVCWQEKTGMGFVQSLESAGLREVGRVTGDCGGCNGLWDRSGESGWYTMPGNESFKDGTGLCYGMVYKLPCHKGKSRFLAGYIMGPESLPTVDFSTIYEESTRKDVDAAKSAAFAADSMAQHAAEEEQAYQAAWNAGLRFHELGELIALWRKTIKGLLGERRAIFQFATKQGGWKRCDAVCEAIRRDVTRMLMDISKARKEREKLKAGDYVSEWLPGFYAADKRMQQAFNDH